MEYSQFIKIAFFYLASTAIICTTPAHGMYPEQQDFLGECPFTDDNLELILQALDGQAEVIAQAPPQEPENITYDSNESHSPEEHSVESEKAASDCSSSDASEHKCLYNKCGQNFDGAQVDQFHEHVIQHLSSTSGKTTKKNIDCPWDDCKVTVKNRNYLRAHIFLHIDKRPFQCPYPSCRFVGAIQRGNFNKHLKEQHKNTKHSCRVCSESFNSQKNLLEHFWLHPGYAPFTCAVCKNGFDGYDVYKKHKQEISCAKPINE